MSRTTSSWVHGYAVVAENLGSGYLEWQWPGGPRPFTDVTGFRQAFGASFRLKGPNDWHWFHVSIPTPTLLLDRRASISKAYALFDARGCFLKELSVFDGSRRVDGRRVNVTGDHSVRADGSNTWDFYTPGGVPATPPLNFGIGLTLRFSTVGTSEVFFAGFGVDFSHDV